MNVRFLETFLWVATLRSVSAAAKRLGVSQSVVSMRIAALQRALGADLYHGGGQTFELTPAGQRVLSKCEAIVSLTVELEEEVKQSLSAPEAIRIGVSEIIALSWLPEFLLTLGEDIRSNSATIKSGTISELSAWLHTGEIDIAFIVGPVNDPSMTNDFICQYDIKWVGAPSLLGGKAEIDLYELAQLPIIQSPRNSYRYEKVLEYFRWHSVSGSPDLQPRNWIGLGFGMMACAQLASKGVGVTALPVTAFEDYVERGQLQVLPVHQEFLPWQIVASSKRINRSDRLDRVIDYARTAASEFARTSGSKYFKADQPRTAGT
jgi:DNA-binding transcriptional LysR family regulator